MTDIIIRETTDYDKLVPFFIENQLEFTEEDAIETPTDLVKLWEAVREEDEKLIGGFVLARRDGEYICDGIAVDSDYRAQNLGRQLLQLGVNEIRERGGDSLYLVARAPGFFRKQGFVNVGNDKAPNFFECHTCPQYGVDCHPEVMLLEL